jgi:hypothetical protein
MGARTDLWELAVGNHRLPPGHCEGLSTQCRRLLNLITPELIFLFT